MVVSAPLSQSVLCILQSTLSIWQIVTNGKLRLRRSSTELGSGHILGAHLRACLLSFHIIYCLDHHREKVMRPLSANGTYFISGRFWKYSVHTEIVLGMKHFL